MAADDPRAAGVDLCTGWVPCVDEPSGSCFRIRDLTCDRSPVHMDVEDREKDANALYPVLDKLSLVGLFDFDDHTVRGRHGQGFIAWRLALRVAEEVE